MLGSNQESLAPLEDPKPVGVLDDIEGDEPHLLPRSAQNQDLRVEFPQWHNSEPSDQDPEYAELFWDGDSVERKKYTAHPIAPSDLFIDVPVRYLSEGQHELLYEVTSYTGDEYASLPYTLTIDVTPPVLATDNKLIFPAPVLPPNALTADYLTEPQNGDQVLARVPAYRTPAPGDVVIATWKNPNDGTSGELRSDPLTHLNYTDPITLAFSGDFIRDLGDGLREVSYRVEDRAFNPTLESDAVALLVAAIRPPRYAPNPWVMEIEDEPSDWGELNPERTLQGATVRIPADAVYFKDDQVDIWFGEPGSPGAVSVPVDPDARDVKIDKEIIAGFLDSTLPVSYLIHLPDGSTMPSMRLTLKVRAFPPGKLPTPQLGAPHSDPVYKSQITAAGLPVIQPKWPYISTRCLITLTVTGGGKSETLLEPRKVLPDEVTGGVAARITQGFMLGLDSDLRFTVKTTVSFDDGGRWFDFIELRPMLRD